MLLGRQTSLFQKSRVSVTEDVAGMIASHVPSAGLVLVPDIDDGMLLFNLLDTLVSSADGDVDTALARLRACSEDVGVVERARSAVADRYPTADLSRVEAAVLPGPFADLAARWLKSDVRFGLVAGLLPSVKVTGLTGFGDELPIIHEPDPVTFLGVVCSRLTTPGGLLMTVFSRSLITDLKWASWREFLRENGRVAVQSVPDRTEPRTDLLLRWEKTGFQAGVVVDGSLVDPFLVDRSRNFSWGIRAEHTPFFIRPLAVGDFLTCSEGLVTGNDRLFVREVGTDGGFSEPMRFRLVDELQPGNGKRLPYLGMSAKYRSSPVPILPPHRDYAPISTAEHDVVFSSPRCYIFWRGEGEAVRRFVRSQGHGWSGSPGVVFDQDSVCWTRYSDRLLPRWLPSDTVVSSEAPAGILRGGGDPSELFFLLGWLLTSAASLILTDVFDRSGDVSGEVLEMLPYPAWISKERKQTIVEYVRRLVAQAHTAGPLCETSRRVAALDVLFEHDSCVPEPQFEGQRDLFFRS